jgi:hypothetical protein
MTEFCPPGFRFLTDVREEIGHDELKAKLMAGDLEAYSWNDRSRWDPLKYIPTMDWWKANTDTILEKGEAWLTDFDAKHVSSSGGSPILIADQTAPASTAML